MPMVDHQPHHEMNAIRMWSVDVMQIKLDHQNSSVSLSTHSFKIPSFVECFYSICKPPLKDKQQLEIAELLQSC